MGYSCLVSRITINKSISMRLDFKEQNGKRKYKSERKHEKKMKGEIEEGITHTCLKLASMKCKIL